jgi:hypothetical protein
MKTPAFDRSFVFVRTGNKVMDSVLEKLELELRKLYQYQDSKLKEIQSQTPQELTEVDGGEF